VLDFQLENNLSFIRNFPKFIILKADFHWDTEEDRTYLFGKIGNRDKLLISEEWEKKNFTIGVGVKTGKYNQSYSRFNVFLGTGGFRNTVNYEFLDFEVEKKKIIGLNLGIGMDTRIEWLSRRFWTDINACYTHFQGRNLDRVDLGAGIGLRIFKGFGLRLKAFGIKQNGFETKTRIGVLINLLYIQY
jgi:hypothetical protein